MGKQVVMQMSRCIWVMDEAELKRYIPMDAQLRAIRRGKGVSRLEKSYNAKGSGKHATKFSTE